MYGFKVLFKRIKMTIYIIKGAPSFRGAHS